MPDVVVPKVSTSQWIKDAAERVGVTIVEVGAGGLTFWFGDQHFDNSTLVGVAALAVAAGIAALKSAVAKQFGDGSASLVA